MTPQENTTSQKLLEMVQEQRRQAEERLARLRELQVGAAERSLTAERFLKDSQERFARTQELRQRVYENAARVQQAFGSLPFMGGASRILQAGLAGAQTGGPSAATATASTSLSRSANTFASAASQTLQASRFYKEGATGIAHLASGRAMAMQAAVEATRFAVNGTRFSNPQLMESVEYQSDRLQAGAGRIAEPLWRFANWAMRNLGDTLFGAGFQLNNPQISSSAAEIRNRLQLAAAAGATRTTGGILGKPLNNPDTTGVGAGIGAGIGGYLGAPLGMFGIGGGAVLGAQIGDYAEEGVNWLWKDSWARSAYRGIIDIFD